MHPLKEILSSIASQYDVFGMSGPLLNRSKLFLHRLQCNKDLVWDKRLNDELISEWKNIARQANSSGLIEYKRSCGERSANYKLVAFSDSSKDMYGCVSYLSL